MLYYIVFILLIYLIRNVIRYDRLKYTILLYRLETVASATILDIGLLVECKGFSPFFHGDKSLLGDGYARVFFLHMYMQLHGMSG